MRERKQTSLSTWWFGQLPPRYAVLKTVDEIFTQPVQETVADEERSRHKRLSKDKQRRRQSRHLDSRSHPPELKQDDDDGEGWVNHPEVPADVTAPPNRHQAEQCHGGNERTNAGRQR